MKKMGKSGKAIGFAVYLDTLERLEDNNKEEKSVINVALPKGRLGEKVYAIEELIGMVRGLVDDFEGVQTYGKISYDEELLISLLLIK